MIRRCFAVTVVGTMLIGAIAAGTTRATAQSDTTAPTTQAAPPTLELLDRGDTPREELRYTLPPGTTQSVRMRTVANIRQESDGRVSSGNTPIIRFTISAEVTEVAPDGNLRVAYAYPKIEVSESGPRSVIEQTREALEPLIGAAGVFVMTPTGAVVANELPTSPDLEPATAQVLEQLTSQSSQLAVPVPEEAVGDGARWRSTSVLELGGLTFLQRATYTLERDRSGRALLDIAISQRAAHQTFTPTGSSQPLTLLFSRAKGSGTSVLELDRAPLPIAGSSEVETHQRLRADGQLVNQTTRLRLFINDKP